MAISDSDFRTWLQQLSNGRGNPVVLIEADHYDGDSEETLYLSDAGYIDPEDIDSPNYAPVILGEVTIDESIDASIIGAIEIFNINDAWRDFQFIGYDFRVYFGDKSWPRSDFRLQGYNKVEDFTSPRPDRYRFEFRDLRSMYFDQLVNGNGLGASAGLPFVFGRVFNMEPLRASSTRFVFYTPAIVCDIAEVRDNGVPVTISDADFNPDGTGDGLEIELTLSSSPSGRVTLDIRDTPWGTSGGYDGTLGPNMYFLLQKMNQYIQIPIPLGDTVADVEEYDIGYVFYQYGTVDQMLREMCSSLGLNPRINKAGELDLIQISDGGTSTRQVFDGNIRGYMSIDVREPPYKQLEIGYQRNWAVQNTNELAGSVSAADNRLYTREYSYDIESRTLTGYPFVLNSKRDTLIYKSADAGTELDRCWNLRDVERQQWSFKGDATFIADEIADTITINHQDYGLSAGADFVILKNRKNLTTLSCQVGVWK